MNLEPAFLRRVARACDEAGLVAHKGFAVLDRDLRVATWIHRRPFLQEGLQVESGQGSLAAGYAGLVPAEADPEALAELLRDHPALFRCDDLAFTDAQGHDRPLPADPGVQRTLLPICLGGRQMRVALPTRVRLYAGSKDCAVELSCDGQTSWFVARGLTPGPLEATLQVRCHPSQDRFSLTLPVATERWVEAPWRAHRGFREDLTLHLVVDRTMLDDVRWHLGLNAALGAMEAELTGLFEGDTPPEQPSNKGFLESLDRAVDGHAGGLAARVSVQLYWYGDRPGAHSDDGRLPTVGTLAAAGRAGSWSRGRLMGPDFGYVRGFDLFDAADEAMLLVVDAVKRAPSSRHAVLFVGDSPPPPSSPSGPLWKTLVAAPIPTSARCSAGFVDGLSTLRGLEVPVAWVVPQPGRMAPGTQAERFVAHQERVRLVAGALSQLSGLHVVEQAQETLPEGIARALDWLVADSTIQRMDVREVRTA